MGGGQVVHRAKEKDGLKKISPTLPGTRGPGGPGGANAFRYNRLLACCQHRQDAGADNNLGYWVLAARNETKQLSDG